MAALNNADTWISLFTVGGVEGLPVETIARALIRQGVELDSPKGEVIPKGTRIFAYAAAESSTRVERVLVRGQGPTGIHGWVSSKFLPPAPSAAAARKVFDDKTLAAAVRVVPPLEPLALEERATPGGLAYSFGRAGRSAKDAKAPTPLVLFAHGAGFNRGTWLPALRELHARLWDNSVVYDVIALDWTAHGRSRGLDGDGPPSAGRYVWRDVFPRDVAELLEAEGRARPVYGVGHSMGGAGLVLAELARPGTFRGLLLVDPIVARPPPEVDDDPAPESMPNVAMACARRSRFDDCDSKADVAAYFRTVGCVGWQDAAVEAYVDYGVDDDMALTCAGKAEASVYLAVARGLADAFPRLGELSCPVHVATGGKSRALAHLDHLPDTMEEILRPVAAACAHPLRGALALPGDVDAAFSLAGRGAYLVVAKDVGHDVMMEVPAWTAALVAASLDELAERRWG